MSNARTYGTIHSEQKPFVIQHTDSTDYLLGGSLVMKNGKIDKILFDGGYAQASVATKTTDKFAFNFYNQDHLGNNREVVDAKGAVQQVTNYYPFGAPYADATAVKNANLQQYKYNGKELDLMHGLNTYDYGARQYDPILCRMDKIDRFCEKDYSHSPYTYCMGNPIRSIDVNGDSCMVLLAPYGAQNFGHLAISIQNEKGEWCLYSKNGTYENNGFSGKEGAKGTDKHNDRGEKKANSIEAFFRDPSINPPAQEGNPNAPDNAPEYTQGFIIPTTPEQDKKLQAGALSEINKDYNLLISNCAQTVQNALSTAGLSCGNGLAPKYQVYPTIVATNQGKIYNYYDTRSKKYNK